MEQMIKTYLGIFLIMMMTVIGIGIVSAEVEITRARDFKSDLIVEMENSDYNVNVLNACMKQAKEIGYGLEITLFGDDGSIVSYQEGGELPEGGVRLAEIVLSYSYSMGPFSSSRQHSLRGYGR